MTTPRSSKPARAIARIVHKAIGFDAAARWDHEQHLQMSPQERQRAARVLKDRAYPANAPDVRECRQI